MIVLGSMRDFVPDNYDEVWFIMRSVSWLKNKDRVFSHSNVFHVPHLSPTSSLYSWFLSKKSSDNWTQNTFNDVYVHKFLFDIKKNKEAHRDLNLLYYKSKMGKKILLICACGDELMCHRSIIGGLLLGVGADVSSTTQDVNHYLKYHSIYNSIYNSI